VLEKFPEELERRKTHGLVLASYCIAVPECDAVAVGGENAMVGDGSTEPLGGQVMERAGAVSDG
jgi:hypothetical protein